MRGISVRQPWAWAIGQADMFPSDGKLVENRSGGFPKSHRGQVLIQASLSWSPRGASDERVRTLWGLEWGVLPHGPLDAKHAEFVYGAGIAVADLADVHPDTGCCRPWGESEYVGSDQQLHRGVTHLVWEDVRQLDEPVPCKGALGLWTVPPEVEAAVLANLAA